MARLTTFTIAIACVAVIGCRDERKNVGGMPPGGAIMQGVPQTDLQPGPQMPVRRTRNPFAGNANAVAEGKKLYSQYNCSGCHANGGGAIGPPLMDDEWIYGSTAENIFAVIIEGRPQGMPAFGGRIPEYQVWQIVSYVRSLGNLEEDAAKPLTEQARVGGTTGEATK